MQPVESEAFEVMQQFFDYDQTVPLEADVIGRLEKPGYIRERISFRGALGSKVPGYLALPTNKMGPYPVVLLLHGVTSSKESWWEENSTMRKLTIQLLESGYAALSLDTEYHGERSSNNELDSPIALLENERFVQYRDMIMRSTIDYRRGMDYLTTRTEIDTTRIGMIGYSMGGMMTFMLSAVDSRIKTSVACVSPIVTVPYLPTGVHHHAPYIHEVPFLMLMGKNDGQNYTEAQARQLHDLIGSDTKELIFFDSGHMLPAEWTDRAVYWIGKHLN
ncbi:dienelactone hydrolase family protein [Fodinibius roseus]|nr:alpha/beta fold hydrolase [Fodinibius roseus]